MIAGLVAAGLGVIAGLVVFCRRFCRGRRVHNEEDEEDAHVWPKCGFTHLHEDASGKHFRGSTADGEKATQKLSPVVKKVTFPGSEQTSVKDLPALHLKPGLGHDEPHRAGSGHNKPHKAGSEVRSA